MSDLQQTALALWTRLRAALVADGMLATAISSTGPQTTQIVLQLAHDNLLHERQEVWVPIAIVPSPGAEVWARNFDIPELPGLVLIYAEGLGWVDKFTRRRPFHAVTHYIVLPDIGKPLVQYRKPDTKPEPEVL